jgi:GT2 family glycosyltransferase
MINIGIVIPTFNRINHVEKILGQIENQKNLSNIMIKSIVIIDGSTDGTEKMINENFPETIIINSHSSWWWTKCMNEGFKKAVSLGFEYVLVMNDDIEIDENYIQTLWNDYKNLPLNSILGSASVSIEKPIKIESAGTSEYIKWRLKFKSYIKGFRALDNDFRGVHKSWTLSGRGTLIPSSNFNIIGYYDENLIQYGSDDEFCLRANLNKIPVYISWNALILNHTMLTSSGSPFKKEGLKKLFKSYFNKYSVNSLKKTIYLYRKYSYPILLPIYLMIIVLGDLKSYFFNYRSK